MSNLPGTSWFDAIDFSKIEIFTEDKEDSLGKKYDQDKPIFSCLPPDGLIELGKIAQLGAKKYGENNWRKGIRVTRLIDAAYRHLISASSGKDYDEVDGNNHLASAAWNCLVAIQMIKDNKEMDDRYKSN